MSRSHRNDNMVENIGRRMMSRRKKNQIKVLHSLIPGAHTSHWLACCSAPTCCPMCSLCPCCTESEYIAVKRQASKYVFIRENSVEWNEPEIVMKPGSCFGIDPCAYDIQDHVHVMYYDTVSNITDKTRFCNECRTCLCGGRGERIQIVDSPYCFNICQRQRSEIYVEDAQRGMYEIQAARELALKSPLYNDDVQIIQDNPTKNKLINVKDIELVMEDKENNLNNSSNYNNNNNSNNSNNNGKSSLPR